jgi:hypothetical protein
MAFGDGYLPRVKRRDDPETELWIGSEAERNWNVRGLRDRAVGLSSGKTDIGRMLLNNEGDGAGNGPVNVRLVEGMEFEDLLGNIEAVKWVGYVCVRDCTTRVPPGTAEDPILPHWQEMVEIRYGFSPDAWGKGYGTEAAKGIMLWATNQMGVRRFVREK